ncbi:hypothetical protein [Alcanivorax sp. 1008]|uniref:hypothetical protein n=1 Tax=Alcanivorax sp. 1008 TaxID=2816853 RepID=UPI001D4A9BCE|nr:hypothetical protein [Alcanivorax sp. 1008]MCC1497713.1 hypothetical protein [Alcanivorax sp. 1008]
MSVDQDLVEALFASLRDGQAQVFRQMPGSGVAFVASADDLLQIEVDYDGPKPVAVIISVGASRLLFLESEPRFDDLVRLVSEAPADIERYKSMREKAVRSLIKRLK